MAESRREIYENSSLVFAGGLARNLAAWDSVTVIGTLSESPEHIFITFFEDKDKNLPFFRLSIMVLERIAVRSCSVQKKTEREEIKQSVLYPINWHEITSEKPLTVHFGISEKRIFIAINEAAFCTFDFCDPLEQVDSMEIRGDMPIVKHFDQRTIFPYVWPKIHAVNPRDVFSNDVPMRFTPGHIIALSGVPEGNPRGHFIIYFTEGVTKKEAFHFNARFKPNFFVVRNAMNPFFELKNEDRSGGFPFKFGEKFRIAIAFAESEFMIAVNGDEFTTFPYIDNKLLQRLNGLKIKTRRGMEVRILSVEHFKPQEVDYFNFRLYSRLN